MSGAPAWDNAAMSRRTRHSLLIGLVALSFALLGMERCSSTLPALALVEFPQSVSALSRFEAKAAIDVGSANPFDPAEVDARGEFRNPSGAVSVIPAFYTRGYSRRLVGGFEKRAPATAHYWALRFTPDTPGEWSWRWRVDTADGGDQTEWETLTVTAADSEAHGFLRVSPDDPRYLRYDDGTGYFAIGENMSWYGGGGVFDYEVWLDRLAAEGGNYIRLWMPSWAFGIEWDGPLGDYRNRLDRAWQLDQVIEAAAVRGIAVMLNIQNHGPFSTSNSEWPSNPYNAANGGPLTEPRDFITDDESRELFKRRLRYVVARWGYATNLLAWELWNEFNLVFTPDGDAAIDWHREMAQELERLDPHDHLITTSTSGTARTRIWDLPEIDFTQTHFYAWPFFWDLGADLPAFLDFARRDDKPTLLGEVGTDFRGPAETLAGDPEAIGFHDALWAGVLHETFGTGMTWWWDNLIDPQDLYFHFGAVAAFVQDIAFDRQSFVPETPEVVADGRNVYGLALVGSDFVLCWVKDADYQWFPGGPAGAPVPVQGASLTVAGVADGNWLARWLDTRSGAELAVEIVSPDSGTLSLPVPDFGADVALRLERQTSP